MYFIPLALLNKQKDCPFCSGPQTRCLRHAFKDVLLVIVFNHPLYSSIPALRSLYQEAFPSIMICGPNSSHEYPVEKVPIHQGYFAYECMAHAMDKSPNYTGYLLINDDLILNYWNLVSFDRDKIWVGPRKPTAFKGFSPPSWWRWWNSSYGLPQCQKAFDELWYLKDEVEQSVWDLKRSFEILRSNGKRKLFCSRGRSDIFFIPQRFAFSFQIMSSIFAKHQVFLEIAVPTICRLLDFVDDFEQIPGVYLPGRKGDPPVRESKYFWMAYNTSIGFLHPFKLNYGQDREVNNALLNTWIVQFSKSMTKC